MEVYLSATDAASWVLDESEDNRAPYLLQSYFYIRKIKGCFEKAKRVGEKLIIDSGAHSFQKGTTAEINWVDYTKEYARWIKENDSDQIVGYFEMDIDEVIGYEEVLKLRKILLSVTDKIIPVWHKNRGIEEFKNMVKTTKGDFVAITGFGDSKIDLDIKRSQYPMFVKYAHDHGKKIHGLGLTRFEVLKSVPFDTVDSASWTLSAALGGMYGTFQKNGTIKNQPYVKRVKTQFLQRRNFEEWIKVSKYYKRYWNKYDQKLWGDKK